MKINERRTIQISILLLSVIALGCTYVLKTRDFNRPFPRGEVLEAAVRHWNESNPSNRLFLRIDGGYPSDQLLSRFAADSFIVRKWSRLKVPPRLNLESEKAYEFFSSHHHVDKETGEKGSLLMIEIKSWSKKSEARIWCKNGLNGKNFKVYKWLWKWRVEQVGPTFAL